MSTAYGARGQDEPLEPNVELGPDGVPVVSLGLTYDAAQEEALAEPRYALIPAWVVLLVGVGLAAKWLGERI